LKHVLKTFGKPIEILEFDWVTSLRTNGLHRSVEGLWNKTKDVVKDFTYSYGSDARGKAIIQYVCGVLLWRCLCAMCCVPRTYVSRDLCVSNVNVRNAYVSSVCVRNVCKERVCKERMDQECMSGMGMYVSKMDVFYHALNGTCILAHLGRNTMSYNL
jgi:hypothetical protein